MNRFYIPIILLTMICCKHAEKEEALNNDFLTSQLNSDDMKETEYITSVRKDNQWYFINEHNEVLFDKVFTYASYFSDGLACVAMDGLRVDGQDKVYGAYYGAMDEKGDFIENIKSDLPFTFRENRAIISYGPKKMLVDKSGYVWKEAVLSAYGKFNEGKLPVFKDGEIEYWDTNGEIIIGPASFTTQGFSENRALVLLNGKYGYIDGNGDQVVDYIYDGGANFSEGFAAVKKNNEYFFIDKNGTEILGPFLKARSFKEGKAAVFTEGSWRFIDSVGLDVFGKSFAEVDDFSEGMAITRSLDGQLSILNEDGSTTMSDARVAFQFKNGFAIAEKNGMMGYIKKDGSWLIEPEYEQVHDFFKR